MTTYIEYKLTDNSTILIEANELDGDEIIKSSRGVIEHTKTKAKKSFVDAMKDIRIQANLLVKEIEELHVDEAEIKFGINTVGEIGNMAIGKVGAGVNYEITLKWKKPEAAHDQP